jgi:uncharacterized membrane protein
MNKSQQVIKKELNYWYLKLVKWTILTAVCFFSHSLINWQGFDLVIVACCIYCLFIFGVCLTLQCLLLKQRKD